MKNELTLIESHETNGVEWGLSLYGSNPAREDYVACRSETHARAVRAAYERGDITPFLNACLANRDDTESE